MSGLCHDSLLKCLQSGAAALDPRLTAGHQLLIQVKECQPLLIHCRHAPAAACACCQSPGHAPSLPMQPAWQLQLLTCRAHTSSCSSCSAPLYSRSSQAVPVLWQVAFVLYVGAPTMNPSNCCKPVGRPCCTSIGELHAAPRLRLISSAACAVDPEQLVYKRPSCELHTTARRLDLTAAGEARLRQEDVPACNDRIDMETTIVDKRYIECTSGSTVLMRKARDGHWSRCVKCCLVGVLHRCEAADCSGYSLWQRGSN